MYLGKLTLVVVESVGAFSSRIRGLGKVRVTMDAPEWMAQLEVALRFISGALIVVNVLVQLAFAIAARCQLGRDTEKPHVESGVVLALLVALGLGKVAWLVVITVGHAQRWSWLALTSIDAGPERQRTQVRLVCEGTGLTLLLAGLALFFVARITLGRSWVGAARARDDTHLVTRGIYGVFRHPLYASDALNVFGAGLATLNYVYSALTLAHLVVVYAQVRTEERGLVRRFGTAYVEYAERTPGLSPCGAPRCIEAALTLSPAQMREELVLIQT